MNIGRTIGILAMACCFALVMLAASPPIEPPGKSLADQITTVQIARPLAATLLENRCVVSESRTGVLLAWAYIMHGERPDVRAIARQAAVNLAATDLGAKA